MDPRWRATLVGDWLLVLLAGRWQQPTNRSVRTLESQAAAPKQSTRQTEARSSFFLGLASFPTVLHVTQTFAGAFFLWWAFVGLSGQSPAATKPCTLFGRRPALPTLRTQKLSLQALPTLNIFKAQPTSKVTTVNVRKPTNNSRLDILFC